VSDNARWAVALGGEAFDLEDASELFSNAAGVSVCKISVGADRNPTVLIADAFQQLPNSADVLEASRPLIDLLNGLLFVHEPGRKPLRADAVHERKSGSWSPAIHHLRMEVMTGRFRMKGSAVVLQAGGPSPPPPPPPQTIWLKDAFTGSILADVLSFLRGEPDWFDLYKAFELMRDDVNSHFGQHNQMEMGWPKKDDLDFFSESAQVHRHSPVKWGRYDLATAMPLHEARNFVRSLTKVWLDWRCGTHAL
jgi:hypothetical protein